jgi:hypothetical protein
MVLSSAMVMMMMNVVVIRFVVELQLVEATVQFSRSLDRQTMQRGSCLLLDPRSVAFFKRKMCALVSVTYAPASS